MSQRQPPARPRAPRAKRAALSVVHPHAAAIDVHSDLHVVCVGPGQVRSFGAYTADLRAIAEHLAAHGVTTVVLESTGVYRVPLFELLEARGLEVHLVEPSQARHGGARPKTDVLDCQWLQRLHTFGLLRPSFRPPEAVLALRGYWRQRQLLVRYAAGHVQHMQKALEQMNVKLAEVVSSLTSLTGLSIVRAMLRGERDPRRLAALRNVHRARPEAEYARALEGAWRAEHLFALRQAYELYELHQRQISACDQQVRKELARLPDRASGQAHAPRPRGHGRKSNDVRFEAAAPLHRAPGVDLTAIDGIDVSTALVVLAEVGTDVARSPAEKHFASWLGPCPRLDRSNKAEKRRSPRKGKNRVAQALRMAAQGACRTRTALAAFYWRIKARLGGRGAITATAHKLALLVYRALKHGLEYVRQSLEEYERKVRRQQERASRRKAAQLGYELVAKAPPG